MQLSYAVVMLAMMTAMVVLMKYHKALYTGRLGTILILIGISHILETQTSTMILMEMTVMKAHLIIVLEPDMIIVGLTTPHKVTRMLVALAV